MNLQRLVLFLILFSFFKDLIDLFLERGEVRERNINVWLPLRHPCPHPALGTQPAAQACALIGNQSSTQSTEPHQPGLQRLILNQLYDFHFLSIK